MKIGRIPEESKKHVLPKAPFFRVFFLSLWVSAVFFSPLTWLNACFQGKDGGGLGTWLHPLLALSFGHSTRREQETYRSLTAFDKDGW